MHSALPPSSVSATGLGMLHGGQDEAGVSPCNSELHRPARPLVFKVLPCREYPGTYCIYEELRPGMELQGKEDYEIQEAARMEYLRRVGLGLIPWPSDFRLRIAFIPVCKPAVA